MVSLTVYLKCLIVFILLLLCVLKLALKMPTIFYFLMKRVFASSRYKLIANL